MEAWWSETATTTALATSIPSPAKPSTWLILDEFEAVFGRPAPRVLARWTGTYASAPDRTVVVDTPAPGVRLVIVTTGAGASTGFALGEEVARDLFGEAGHD